MQDISWWMTHHLLGCDEFFPSTKRIIKLCLKLLFSPPPNTNSPFQLKQQLLWNSRETVKYLWCVSNFLQVEIGDRLTQPLSPNKLNCSASFCSFHSKSLLCGKTSKNWCDIIKFCLTTSLLDTVFWRTGLVSNKPFVTCRDFHSFYIERSEYLNYAFGKVYAFIWKLIITF